MPPVTASSDPTAELELAPLTFGTDGIRGLVGPVINQESIARIVAGLAQHCATPAYRKRTGLPEGPLTIVVGGDCRSTSDYFAQLAATILQALGVRVLKAAGYVTTPMLAHAVVAQRAHAGIMLTASHNPADHNGVKFIVWYGGPALPEETEAAEPWLNAPPPILEDYSPGTIESLNPAEDYGIALFRLIDFGAIRAAKIRICYDALFGAGKGYFRQLMRHADIPAQVLHGEDDPWMGRAQPDPTAARLTELASQVTHLGFDVGLATDGDADRFAAVDHTGRFVSPHECLAILAHYLYTYQQARGGIVRSLTTTRQLDRIAIAHGERAESTPVGFKFLGARMRADAKVLMAGEESGGFALRGHIPNKDGLLGCFLLLEALAVSGKSLAALGAEVAATYGPAFLQRLDWPADAAGQAAILAPYADLAELTLAGTVFRRTGEAALEFVAADGSWVLLRSSGTEACVRVYLETWDADRLHEYVAAVEALPVV